MEAKGGSAYEGGDDETRVVDVGGDRDRMWAGASERRLTLT